MDRAGLTPIVRVGWRRGPFWRRQFEGAPTRAQDAFDVVVGALLAPLCFYFDPLLFRFAPGPAELEPWAVLAYTSCAVTAAALLVRIASARAPAFFAGVFAVAFLTAFALAVVVVPFLPLAAAASIFDPRMLLGFVPLAVTFVLARQFHRAQAAARAATRGALVPAIAGMALALGIPLAAHAHVQPELERAHALLRARDADDIAQGAEILRRYRWFANAQQVAFAYVHAEDAAQRRALERAYEALTGEDLRKRMARAASS